MQFGQRSSPSAPLRTGPIRRAVIGRGSRTGPASRPCSSTWSPAARRWTPSSWSSQSSLTPPCEPGGTSGKPSGSSPPCRGSAPCLRQGHRTRSQRGCRRRLSAQGASGVPGASGPALLWRRTSRSRTDGSSSVSISSTFGLPLAAMSPPIVTDEEANAPKAAKVLEIFLADQQLGTLAVVPCQVPIHLIGGPPMDSQLPLRPTRSPTSTTRTDDTTCSTTSRPMSSKRYHRTSTRPELYDRGQSTN